MAHGEQAPKTSAFLETTVHAARITLPFPLRPQVELNLSEYRLITSTFVLGEFKEAFLGSAVQFHKLLVDSPNTKVAFSRAERFSDRIYKRMRRMIDRISDEGDMERAALLRRLERMIEWQLVDLFSRGLADISDETGCSKAGAQPVRAGETYSFSTSCRQQPPPGCLNAEFVEGHRAELTSVLEELKPLDSEETRRKSCINEILGDDRRPHGDICRSIADLVIILEVPAGSVLATTNTKHYEPLAAILGRPSLINPVPT